MSLSNNRIRETMIGVVSRASNELADQAQAPSDEHLRKVWAVLRQGRENEQGGVATFPSPGDCPDSGGVGIGVVPNVVMPDEVIGWANTHLLNEGDLPTGFTYGDVGAASMLAIEQERGYLETRPEDYRYAFLPTLLTHALGARVGRESTVTREVLLKRIDHRAGGIRLPQISRIGDGNVYPQAVGLGALYLNWTCFTCDEIPYTTDAECFEAANKLLNAVKKPGRVLDGGR